MSSMLALRPDTVGVNSSRHPYAGGQVMATHGFSDHQVNLRHGLPTPPATSVMKYGADSNGKTAHTQLNPYLYEHSIINNNNSNSNSQQTQSYKSTSSATSARPQNATSNSHHTRENVSQRQEIAAHLQIPSSINNSKGSLPEFAAQITCLFWFESSETLEYAENLAENCPSKLSLNEDARPTLGFSKWVTTIVSTTQVARNVVLLALMFIYRLKKFNPSVSGKRGSEYRLLTIALMLGNKFLDDNTYTNKTWAEVSGISVNEIHIMEVEFLSNMRYELYASLEQWQEWKAKLGRLGSFYEKASILAKSPKASSPLTPITQTISTRLPSPPSRSHTTSTFMPSPDSVHGTFQLARSPAKYSLSSAYLNGRKRSIDNSLDQPPSKRIHSVSTNGNGNGNTYPIIHAPHHTNNNNTNNAENPNSIPYLDQSRLPPLQPTLPMPVNRAVPYLAPLNFSGPRALSTVYAPTTVTTAPAAPINQGCASVPPLTHGHIMPTSLGPGPASLPGSADTSPMNMYGPATPTRLGLSPTYFLWHRSSPYRPVRDVNTLLYPPPSTAMSHAIRPINFEQMQYQPLSKAASEPRLGPMPCLQPDAWMSHVTTPTQRPF